MSGAVHHGSSVQQIHEKREEEETEETDHQNTNDFEEYMMVTNEDATFNYSLNSKINQKARDIIRNNGIKVQGSAKVTSQRNMMKFMNKINAKNVGGTNLP